MEKFLSLNETIDICKKKHKQGHVFYGDVLFWLTKLKCVDETLNKTRTERSG